MARVRSVLGSTTCCMLLAAVQSNARATGGCFGRRRHFIIAPPTTGWGNHFREPFVRRAAGCRRRARTKTTSRRLQPARTMYPIHSVCLSIIIPASQPASCGAYGASQIDCRRMDGSSSSSSSSGWLVRKPANGYKLSILSSLSTKVAFSSELVCLPTGRRARSHASCHSAHTLASPQH